MYKRIVEVWKWTKLCVVPFRTLYIIVYVKNNPLFSILCEEMFSKGLKNKKRAPSRKAQAVARKGTDISLSLLLLVVTGPGRRMPASMFQNFTHSGVC